MDVDMMQKTDEISKYIKTIADLEKENAILNEKNSKLETQNNDLENDIWSLKFEISLANQTIQVYEDNLKKKK